MYVISSYNKALLIQILVHNSLLHFPVTILMSIFQVEYPNPFSLPQPMNLKNIWVLQNISYTPYFKPPPFPP